MKYFINHIKAFKLEYIYGIFFAGYAWSGGGAGIVRVDVTIDQGETWHVAELEFCDKMPLPGRHWAWTLWTAEIAVPKEKKEVSDCPREKE